MEEGSEFDGTIDEEFERKYNFLPVKNPKRKVEVPNQNLFYPKKSQFSPRDNDEGRGEEKSSLIEIKRNPDKRRSTNEIANLDTLDSRRGLIPTLENDAEGIESIAAVTEEHRDPF
jgi:hypothetical protein